MKNSAQDKIFFALPKKKNYILDIDGVLWDGNAPAHGSIEALANIQKKGRRICLLSNDAVSSRHSRLLELNQAGFNFSLPNLFTASFLAAEYVRILGAPKSLVLGGGEGLSEFRGIPLTPDDPQIVVVADYFDSYNRNDLESAFQALLRGAKLIAAQKNRYWTSSGEEKIDVGFWVSGLEYCSGKSATLVGKPSAFSYHTCLKHLGASAEDTAMISDDAVSDLRGAKEIGLTTIHISNVYNGIVRGPQPNVDVGYPSLWEFSHYLDHQA